MRRSTLFFLLLLLISRPVPAQPLEVEARRWSPREVRPWERFATRVVASLLDFTPERAPSTPRYGSDPTKRFRASGFFRVTRERGRWWLVDPQGYAHIQRVVVSF